LGGCGGSSSGGPDSEHSLEQIADRARSDGQNWQAELIEDGDITLAEYDEGHRRVLECLTQAGMTFTEPVRDIVDGFRWNYEITWGDLGEDKGSKAVQECFENLGHLELAMSSFGSWETDPALQANIEQCLRDDGFEVQSGSTKNYRDLTNALAEQGVTQTMVSACIDAGMEKLYPRTAYGIVF
jgi:hypothetical protein